MIYLKKLKLKLTEKQRQFIEKVEKDKNDNQEMKDMLTDNIICIYLLADTYGAKIAAAKMLLKLKRALLEKYIAENIVEIEEIEHYKAQKVSNFKEFDRCD